MRFCIDAVGWAMIALGPQALGLALSVGQHLGLVHPDDVVALHVIVDGAARYCDTVSGRRVPMPVSIRLGPQLEERLAKASRKLRVNKTQVIKRSLEAYLAQLEPGRTAYELGEDLFGADGTDRADLSTGFKRRLKSRLRAKHRR